MSDPQSGRADATIDTFVGAWNRKPFQLDGPARLRYADERLTIDQLRIRAEDSTVSLAGNLPLLDRTAPGAITIDANANLATLVQYLPAGTNLAADGRLTLSGSLQGTLKSIDPNLKLAIVDALVVSPSIEPGLSKLNATATVANGEATVDQLTAQWGSAQIEMSARVPLDLLPDLPIEIPRTGGPATIHARLDGLNPSLIPGAPSGLSGKISHGCRCPVAPAELAGRPRQNRLSRRSTGLQWPVAGAESAFDDCRGKRRRDRRAILTRRIGRHADRRRKRRTDGRSAWSTWTSRAG